MEPLVRTFPKRNVRTVKYRRRVHISVAGTDNYVRVSICPWCGSSAPHKFIWMFEGCDDCGAVQRSGGKRYNYHIKWIIVPKKNIEMKNKHRGRLVPFLGVPAASGDFFARPLARENDVRIAICPWCGCCVSDFNGETPGRMFKCEECGTQVWKEWSRIMVPKRSLGLRDANLGRSSLPKNNSGWVAVCPWCRNDFRKPWPGGISVCNECGTLFHYSLTDSEVPRKDLEKKDKNMHRHNG